MSDMENLARPEYWALIDEHIEAAIDAELVDLHYVLRSTFDPDNGFDVRADFVSLWTRDCFRGQVGVPSFGTHRGCIRQAKGSNRFRVNLDNGHYDQDEASARRDFISRQLGLG